MHIVRCDNSEDSLEMKRESASEPKMKWCKCIKGNGCKSQEEPRLFNGFLTWLSNFWRNKLFPVLTLPIFVPVRTRTNHFWDWDTKKQTLNFWTKSDFLPQCAVGTFLGFWGPIDKNITIFSLKEIWRQTKILILFHQFWCFSFCFPYGFLCTPYHNRM